jgi:hypothetical protein
LDLNIIYIDTRSAPKYYPRHIKHLDASSNKRAEETFGAHCQVKEMIEIRSGISFLVKEWHPGKDVTNKSFVLNFSNKHSMSISQTK